MGELGYEINCRALEHETLRRTLLEAGGDLGVKEFGYNALLSLRLEKSFGIWSAEFTQGYTPRMTGMDRWIAWDKGDFVGRAAALAERDGPSPSRQLVTLDIDAFDADASGYEPVWREGRKVGYVTSGGYGHTVGKSLAMALVAPECAAVGTELAVHVVGVERKARVIAPRPMTRLARRCGYDRAAGRGDRRRAGDARRLARSRAYAARASRDRRSHRARPQR